MIAYSHGLISRDGSNWPAERHARTNARCTASAACSRFPSRLSAVAYIGPENRSYSSWIAAPSPTRKRSPRLSCSIKVVANLTLAAIAFSVIWWHVLRKHLVEHELTPAEQRPSLLRYSIGTVIYAACIGISFISGEVTLLIVFLLALYYGFEQLRMPVETR